ncbi:Sec1 family protein [Toxoplasma gondii CAST]|uniref:Sec1 family protein n=1 Tax=Toxoplasma gondii CAST TaxID=943122 RepID=A0A425HTX6_TOXGO|nr:Sec1 family protein [Toxoplasma gondii CAST]
MMRAQTHNDMRGRDTPSDFAGHISPGEGRVGTADQVGDTAERTEQSSRRTGPSCVRAEKETHRDVSSFRTPQDASICGILALLDLIFLLLAHSSASLSTSFVRFSSLSLWILLSLLSHFAATRSNASWAVLAATLRGFEWKCSAQISAISSRLFSRSRGSFTTSLSFFGDGNEMQKDRLRVDAHQRTAAGSAAASAPPRGRRRPGKAQTALGEENRADEAEGSSWGEEGEGAKLGDRRDETERAGEPEEAETAGDESQLRRACWRKGKMRDTKRLSFAGEASRASLRKKTCAISMSSLRDTRKRCRWREKEELREGERRRQQKGERWGNKERRRKTAKEERGRRTKTREQGFPVCPSRTLFYFRRRSLAAFHRPKNFALTLVSCLCSRPDARLASEKKTEKAERGHTMSLNLQERQAAALQAMLALVPQRASSAFTQTDAALPQASTAWKILIFDSAAKDILAPLMTVRTLESRAATSNKKQKKRRDAVSRLCATRGRLRGETIDRGSEGGGEKRSCQCGERKWRPCSKKKERN